MRALIRTARILLISSSVIIVIAFLLGASISQVLAVIFKYGLTGIILITMFGAGMLLADDAEVIAKEIADKRAKKLLAKQKLITEKELLSKKKEEETNRILKDEGIEI